MIPDIKTLLLLNFIISVISAGVVAVIWGQNRGRFAGISFWLAGVALQTAGSVLIVLRGLVPDLISMTLANTMIMAGLLIILIGLERFTGKKGWQIHNYILLAVFIAVIAYFAAVQPNLMAREIAVSAMLMIFACQCCWLLLRRVDPRMRRVTRLTGIVFAVYAAFSFARMVLTIIFPVQSNDFYDAGAVNALTITGYIVLNICLNISLILMVNNRLLADVKSQEVKFTTAFKSSPYAITLTRPSDGRIFEVNEGFVDISGYQYSEIIGKTTLDLNLWVNEKDRLAVVSELARGREVHAVEYQFRHKTGKVITGLFSANLITVNNERCILSNIGDISKRKQAEEELKESEEKYRILLDESSDPFFSFTPEGQYKYVNKAFAKEIGKPVGDIIGKRIWDIFPKEHADRRFAVLSQVFSSGEEKTIEIPVPLAGGERYYLSTLTPIKDAAGKVISVIGSSKDITARRRTDEALREREERHRTLLQTAMDGFWMIDLQGRLQEVNDAYCRMSGYSAQELMAMSVPELEVAEAADDTAAHIQKVMAHGEDRFETQHRRKDGSIFDVEISVQYRTYEDGGRMVAFLRDITEHKIVEEKLAKSYESVKKTLNDAIDTIAKIVETRDPYTAGHQRKVAELAVAIGSEMKLEDDRIDQIRMAAIIHDIGKMYVPSDILSKPGKLSDIEFSLIKTHSQGGYDIVKDMDFPCVVAQAILQHHERLDGSGYPNGLKGEDTLLEAKILAVADVVEAMFSHRPYRPALGVDKALQEISINKGKLYDPAVVDACLELFQSAKFQFKTV